MASASSSTNSIFMGRHNAMKQQNRGISNSRCIRIKATAEEQQPPKINGSSVIELAPMSISSVLSQKAAAVFSVASETSYALSGAVLSAIAGVTQQQPQPENKTEIPIDALKQGRLVENRQVYRQTFVIRSYEVGADRNATMETFLNLFQETALNHVLMSGLAGDGFGATHEMVRKSLIWVVTRMQVEVEQYPSWGNALEIDTWVGASGKNGMRRDWLVREYKSGSILARATSTWVMMHKRTRRLSKMPSEVRAELRPWFLNRNVLVEEKASAAAKIGHAQHIHGGIMPQHSDLDMNQHVNNVKYLNWMIGTIPPNVLETHYVFGITLEFRKECGKSDVVESLAEEQKSSTSDGDESGRLVYAHSLRMQNDGSEIVRARTAWKKITSNG